MPCTNNFVHHCIGEWLKIAEKWVDYYTDNYPHMGISTSQRAESAHSAIKRAIEATSDLEPVFDHIDRCLNLQNLKDQSILAKDLLFIDPFVRNDSRFRLIVGKVARWVVDKLKKL